MRKRGGYCRDLLFSGRSDLKFPRFLIFLPPISMDADADPALSNDLELVRSWYQHYESCSEKQGQEILRLKGQIRLLQRRLDTCKCATGERPAQAGPSKTPKIEVCGFVRYLVEPAFANGAIYASRKLLPM